MAYKKDKETSGNIDSMVFTTAYGEDFSKELAVLHSDMDEITKIKIIQALKKPDYSNIYWGDGRWETWQPQWTVADKTNQPYYNVGTTGGNPNKFRTVTTAGNQN